MNELYLEKLISLTRQGIITATQIKDIAYKTEVERILALEQEMPTV